MPERARVTPGSDGLAKLLMSVLTMVVAIGIVSATGTARAQSGDLFAVTGIEVDTTGENDLAAKRAGVAEAKARAFRTLIERLTVDGDSRRVSVPDPDRLEFLIRDVTYEQEKFGGGRYLAELSVRFNADAVGELLEREGIAYAETESRPLVVVPVLERPGEAPVLWLGGNTWLDAWLGAPSPQGLVPIIAPLGDLNDISAIDASAALAGDARALEAIEDAYSAGGAVVVHARPDAANDSVTVAIRVRADGWPDYRTEARFTAPPPEGGEATAGSPDGSPDGAATGGANAVEAEAPGETEGRLLGAAVDGTVALLEEAWSRENLIRYDQAGTVLAVRAPLDQLGDLVMVRRALDGAAPVRSVTLDRLTTTEAEFAVEFVGDIYQLQTALVQAGLTLDLSEDATTWLVRPLVEDVGEMPSSDEGASGMDNSSAAPSGSRVDQPIDPSRAPATQ
ncbi:DUF2066 domain-containing protein [Marivibrio halodurans]|uniref:DUF2066 domain-containing protein n=1 Tax=Marivibrio halodurans TaxID=2039722 RepID=A0A8J7RWQ2_9PROT|nr:DUF2066 domain-containing protein [Marivibrio halodurans]MBP5856127.1 DUF2066 domain-containing protein [Marivibrio halodurans]